MMSPPFPAAGTGFPLDASSGSRPARLRLLGTFTLDIHGVERSAGLGYDRARLILAILALHQGQPMERRQLAHMVWPQEDLPTARARLRHALHMLRSAFQPLPQALRLSATRVAVEPGLLDVDVLRVAGDEAAAHDDETRLHAYGGALLEGLNLPQSEAVGAWVQEWEARIDIELAQCRTRLAEQYLQSGDLTLALDRVKSWVQLWPHDELCHRHLIRLLLRLNQRDAAVRAYEHCASVLAQMTGGSPGAETRALLGLENQPLDTKTASPRHAERRSHIPLAVLALALSWDAQPQDDIEDTLAHLEDDRNRIIECLISHGAWLPQLGETTLQAYFGYPAPFERPVQQAIALARILSRLELHPQVRLGQGLHADIALAESGSRPDSGGLLSHEAVGLAWKAGHREVALSAATATRLDESELITFRRHGQRLHALRAQPLPMPPQRMHGRANEFDSLVQQWARLAPGRPPTSVQISGPAGIGKSLLAGAMTEYVEKTGGLAIRLECEENRRETPWRPLARWLQEELASHLHLPGGSASDLRQSSNVSTRQALQQHLGLAAHAAQELENLMHTGSSLAHLNHTTPALLEAAMAALTSRATAARPKLIVVENLHWSDQATLSLIRHLAATRVRAPLMLLLTCREQMTAPWADRQLLLSPLPAASISALVAHRAKQLRIPRELRAHIAAHSQGIPLYAHAMLQLAAHGRPLEHVPQVIDMICLQVSQLSAEARQIVLAITLLNRPLSARQLQAILGLTRMRAELGIQQALKPGLVMEDGEGLHCPLLVRNAVVRITTQEERRQLRERMAHHLIDSMAAPSPVAATAAGIPRRPAAASPPDDEWHA